MNPKKEFADYLQCRRRHAGLPQSKVAKILGYKSAQFISNWERGLSMPPLRTLPTLAKLYQVSAEALYQKMEKSVLNCLVVSLRKEFEKSGSSHP